MSKQPARRRNTSTTKARPGPGTVVYWSMEHTISPRLTQWVTDRFGAEATFLLHQLAGFRTDGDRLPSERLLAAIAFVADDAGLPAALDLARRDWRDVLVSAGLGDEDWPAALDDILGPDGAGGG